MPTIFSLITSINSGSVAVVRLSGSKVKEILLDLGFKGKIQHQKASLQKIRDPKSKEILDEALVTFFESPNSFTGEDVAEISLHASSFIVKNLFQILSEIQNVRQAEAGEFSKRAFLNGKIDLVQAEAIPDLIASETALQHQQAIKQMQGELGKIYEAWRVKLIEVSAKLEAYIDFPDEDLPQNIIDHIEGDIKNLQAEIFNHLDDQKIGQKIKDGLSLAIIGAPNAGKSSLINYLAKSEVAIVSKIAGTTRDIIEIHLAIAGFAVKIADTAGLRNTEDEIEQEGIKRAIKKAQEADLKIFILDAVNPILRDEDLNLITENTILLINKIDQKISHEKLDEILKKINKSSPIYISLIDKINLSELVEKIQEEVLKIAPKTNAALITQERYRAALKDCLSDLEKFNLQKNIELAAEDLRMAARNLGKITGKIDIENILDVIFSSFCIGK